MMLKALKKADKGVNFSALFLLFLLLFYYPTEAKSASKLVLLVW